MKFGSVSVVINPPFPVKQAGHIIQVDEIFTVHDDLHARLLYLEGEGVAWLHVSADSLGLPLCVQETLEQELSLYWNKPINVTVSATHAHHCCDPENEGYLTFFMETVLNAAKNMRIREVGELAVSYRSQDFDELGKSRISNHKADAVKLDLIQILSGDTILAEIIVHNVHPTVLYAKHPFFSAEYPGYVLQRLHGRKPEIFHTFMQGPAGDTSTRFTRKSQDYDSVIELGEKMVHKILEMKTQEAVPIPLKLSLEKKVLPLQHEFQPIDMSKMPTELSEREQITMSYGPILREQLKEHPEKLEKEILLTMIDFGGPRIIFAPNEMFSWWRTLLDASRCTLVCYSNGAAPYLTGPGQYLLTYETFTDTVTDESKEQIVKVIRSWNGGN